VQTCVIFNPSAKGDKARRFRRHLDEISTQSSLKLTTGPGDARRLAAEAIQEGFETIVAAGGDGTVNEVLNGIGDSPKGFERARLGVLPLGTVNVFARELGISSRLEEAWRVIRLGRERLIDLPKVGYPRGGEKCSRFFAQLAGAGLDARAIELVHWNLKKRIGPLAYVIAGLRALLESPAKITAGAAAHQATGGLVLVGNGMLYGGPFRVFPRADLCDGQLEVCVFPRVNWFTLARCGPQLLLRGDLPDSQVECFRAETVTLTGAGTVPLEVDGELIGALPATFSVQRGGLRVIVPAGA
jgi:diacylglycerol kinase (ATP)